MKHNEFYKIRSSFFKEFLKENIRIEVRGHAEERATEGERGEEVKNEYLIDFFSCLLHEIKAGTNRDLCHVINLAKNNFLEQHVTIQANFGAKKRQINVPAVFRVNTFGILKIKIKTLMVKEQFKFKQEHRLIQI